MHQGAAEGARIEPNGEAVREAEQEASADRGGVGDAVADGKPLPFREAQELTGGLVGLARGLAVHAKTIAGVGVEL